MAKKLRNAWSVPTPVLGSGQIYEGIGGATCNDADRLCLAFVQVLPKLNTRVYHI